VTQLFFFANSKSRCSRMQGLEAAILKPPFDVVEVFKRKGRVPRQGRDHGFPFRSSLMNMGEGNMMVVNAPLAAGAKCKGGVRSRS